MVERADVTQLIVKCLDEVLAQTDGVSPGPVDESTSLIGRSAVLGSLGLVTLIVDVEQRLQAEHGITVTLVDDRAMSQKHSPFRTVRTLVDYICTIVEE
jgi:acyl carrier protein